MISRRFILSSLTYTLSGALPTFAGFVLLPFYTNLLTTNDYGNLALLFSMSLLLQVFFNLGLDATMGVEYVRHKADEGKLKLQTSSLFSGLLISGLFIGLLCLIAGPLVFGLVFETHPVEFMWLGPLLIGSAFFSSYTKTFTNLLIYRKQNGPFIWINLLGFAFTVGVTAICLWLYPYSLYGPLWGRFAGALVPAAVSFAYVNRWFGHGFSRHIFNNQVRVALPMLGYFLVFWGAGYLDRFIIGSELSAREVAVYDFGLKCVMAVEILQMGLGASINPRVYELMEKSGVSEASREITKYFSGFTAVFMLALPALGPAIALLAPLVVYNEDYYESFRWLPLMCSAYAFRGLFIMFLSPLLYYQKTALVFRLLLAALFLQFFITSWMVHAWGIAGACLALPIGRIIQVLFLGWGWQKQFGYRFNVRKLIWLPAIYTVLCVALSLSGYSKVLITGGLVMCVMWLLVFVFYRNEIVALWPKLLKR